VIQGSQEQLVATSSESSNSDQPITEHVNEIRLSETFTVSCPTESLPNEYTFQEIVFNRSLENVDLSSVSSRHILDKNYIEIESTRLFRSLFGSQPHHHRMANWTDHEIIVEFSQFSDTGRYYCVYSKRHHHSGDNDKSYLITSAPYIVYDG
jgi:hypothetical protein